MMIHNRVGVVALGACLVILAGQFPSVAQEPAKQTTPASKKKGEPSRRVPAYFGQIGLTPEQKATIYSVQAKHQEKIDALEKQIATHKAEMLAECEGVLTETQKKLLTDLRKAAADPAKPVDTSKTAK